MRPSSGAETGEPPARHRISSALHDTEVAATEDGRTPLNAYSPTGGKGRDEGVLRYWSTISQPHRLDAESLRDAMLAVSGELDLSSGGPYVPTKTDKQGQIVIDEKQSGAHRRSLYLQQRRTYAENFLSTFDGPAHNPVCVQRVSSTVALQSLSLLNSDFVRNRARALARRIMPESASGSAGVSPANGEDQACSRSLHRAVELAYCRAPKPDELSAAETFLREQAAIYSNQPDAPERIWTDLCQMLLASNAFLYVD